MGDESEDGVSWRPTRGEGFIVRAIMAKEEEGNAQAGLSAGFL